MFFAYQKSCQWHQLEDLGSTKEMEFENLVITTCFDCMDLFMGIMLL